MDFGLLTPCPDCPFRRSTGVRLHPARANEIGSFMLNSQGGTFICHKTAHSLGASRKHPEQHCAGALIFAERHDTATQPMRIAERLGIYDRDRLMADAPLDDIWESLDDFVQGQHHHATRNTP